MLEEDDNIADDALAPDDEQDEQEDILETAKKDFERVLADISDQDNKTVWLEDVKFAQLAEQWDERILAEREQAGKPSLSYPKLAAVIRQVVNDARQNKPSIKVLPVDDDADVQTAEILSDLIRNIEHTSKAPIAYDTAAEHAAAGGHGYWAVDIDYPTDGRPELEIQIKRIVDPCSVYGDPDSEAADSSDWMFAFRTQRYSKTRFEREFGTKATKIDWDGDQYGRLTDPWRTDEGVLVAHYWRRELYEMTSVVMSDGSVYEVDALTPDLLMALQAEDGIVPVREVTRPCYKVTQYVMTGAEILKTIPWPGQYIPIVPVYGHEYWAEGRRYLRGVVHDAKDAQKAYNFWRSVSTELVAMAPKAPWLAHEDTLNEAQVEQFALANRMNIPVLTYGGNPAAPPQRMPLDMGSPAGAITEALSAADDIKAITGIYDASLGNRSNETSGVAINARKVEGDTSTFNFPDNVARAINHTGVILLDVIPKVYDEGRIIRVLGIDDKPKNFQVGQEMPVKDPESGEPMMEQATDPMTGEPLMDPATQEPVMVPMTRILDLGLGKYDVAVQTGPSYTTRRQEALQQMTEVFQAAPDLWADTADLYLKAIDAPFADEFSKRLKERRGLGGPPPEVQEMQSQMEEMNGAMEQAGQQMQQLQAENEQLKAKTAVEMEKLAIERENMALEREKLQIEAQKLQIEQQKIAADLEKARISAAASRPMMLQPAPMAQQPTVDPNQFAPVARPSLPQMQPSGVSSPF